MRFTSSGRPAFSLTLSFIVGVLFLSPDVALSQQEELTSDTGTLNVRPGSGAVASLSVSDVQIMGGTEEVRPNGDTTALQFEIENQGEKAAQDITASMSVETDGRVVSASERDIGTLDPQSTEPVEFSVAVDGTPKELPLRMRLQGQFDQGEMSVSRTLAVASPTPIVDRDIPTTSMERPNAVAVVIGVKEYEHSDVPNVDYALSDARTMKKYLTQAFGFREENVIVAENASGSEMRRLFGTESDPKGQLYNYLRKDESEVFVYYSGHGAPDPESEKAYLLGADTNPNYMSINGYPVNQLYRNLTKIPAKSVTVALDACFSGVSESGQIVQNVSPAVLSVENPIVGMENGLAFTAGAADQVSSWYPEKKHGLFTYYFLRGLRGEADTNEDQAITAQELETYLTKEVPYRARRMHNREQVPQVVGRNKDRVLVRYADTPPAGDRE